MENRAFKRLMAMILAIAMIFALSACGKKPVPAADDAADAIQSLTTKEDVEQAQAEAEEAAAAEAAQEPEAEGGSEDDAEADTDGEKDERTGINGRYSEDEIAVEYKKFSEMEYSRPDLDAFTAAVEHATEVLNSDASYEEICRALDEYEIECGRFNTMYVIAEIRSYMDMTDEFYADEYAWVDENQAVFAKAEDHMFYAAAANKHIDKLEEDYFWEGFAEEYDDESESVYTDSYMELDKQEKALLTEYRDMVANPTILYHGEERNADELFAELSGYEYLEALEKYYDKYNPKLADIYIRLIKVRNAIAEERGYENYELYAYEEGFERDYTPDEAAVLTEAVGEYIIPAYEKINSMFNYYSVDYFEVSEEFLVSIMDDFTGNMGGDVRAAFEFMREYELYDVSVSTKKANMSFETYIEDYESPFILSDCMGDSEDVLTFAHEFGHFCRDYVNYGQNSGIDVQEIFSQAMEYLSLFYLDSDTVNEDELYSLLLAKVLDVYSSYVQAGYAEFEHRVFSMDPDKLNAKKINEIWLDICEEYNMSEPGFEYLYEKMWIDIPHFFEYPFYVISYTVSNEVAMQVFELAAENEEAALEKYGEMLLCDSDKLLELVEECGLDTPFSSEQVKASADFLLGIANNVL